VSCAQVSLTFDRFLPTWFSMPIDDLESRSALLVPGVTERTTMRSTHAPSATCDSISLLRDTKRIERGREKLRRWKLVE
jgi:hypothetical protein